MRSSGRPSALERWKHWRWLVALACVPMMIGAAAAFAVGVMFNQMFHSKELGFLTVLAVLVVILEMASLIFAKKPSETPPSEDPDNRWTSILQ